MNINNYKYITNQIFPHGIGTRISFLVNAISFSKFENKEFVITPFSYQTEKKEFNSNPRTKTYDYIGSCVRWDTLLNLKNKKISDLQLSEINKVLHLCFPNINNVPPKSRIVNDKIRNLRSEIKSEYFKIPKKNKNEKVIVSVHIRRGDACRFKHRFLPNEYYVKTINTVEDFLRKNDVAYEIKIYTQKLGFYGNGLDQYNVIFDDEILDNDVWVNLLNSDIIIGSNSALSSSVGMLTDGIFIQSDKNIQVSDWLYGPELNYEMLNKKYYEVK